MSDPIVTVDATGVSLPAHLLRSSRYSAPAWARCSEPT